MCDPARITTRIAEGVNYMWSQILNRLRPCVACDIETHQPVCVLCRRALQGPVIEISPQESAAHITHPVARRLLSRYQKSGHPSVLEPFIPGLVRALPQVPTVLRCIGDDPVLDTLRHLLARRHRQFAIGSTTRTGLKTVWLGRTPHGEADGARVYLLSHD
jgi:hypothetical protein